MGRSQRPLPRRLGEKLRQIRESLGLTLEQMIGQLDYASSPIYPTNISAMERGEREPPLPLLLSYARLVGISTDVLIDDGLSLPNELPAVRKQARKKGATTSLKKSLTNRARR